MRTPQTGRGHESIRRRRAARWLVPAGLLALAPAAAAGLVALEPVLVEGRVLMKAEPQAPLRAGAAAILAAGPLARE